MKDYVQKTLPCFISHIFLPETEKKMIAVIFEVHPTQPGKAAYLDLAAALKEELSAFTGLVSIERFQSLVEKGKLLSLSFWEDEKSIEK